MFTKTHWEKNMVKLFDLIKSDKKILAVTLLKWNWISFAIAVSILWFLKIE